MIVTYLGHQGWAFDTSVGTVFLDPIFKTIGNAGVQLPVWPDREIDTKSLPRIGGLIISHEHSDHFDIDTLLRMPWRGTVYISDRSSQAIFELLVDLGYTPVRLGAYDEIQFGDVNFRLLPLAWSLLEPDAYGYLVRSDDDTSFFTSVDGMPHQETIQWLKKHCPLRTVDNFTNNYLEPLPELTTGDGADKQAVGMMVSNLMSSVNLLAPRRVVMSGQGWSYPPKYSELNHRFFSVTHQALLPIMQDIYPDIRWQAPEPGTYIGLAGEECDGSTASYVIARSPTNRDYHDYTRALSGEPWSRNRSLGKRALDKVLDFIQIEFARKIDTYGHRLIRRLYELSLNPTTDLMPTIALRILNGDDAYHFIMDQGWLRFVSATDDLDIRSDVAAGIEIWASDLELLINGNEEPYLVYETAVRRWCNVSSLISSSVHVHIFLAFGPRNQPEEYLEGYRARLRKLRQTESSAKELRCRVENITSP